VALKLEVNQARVVDGPLGHVGNTVVFVTPPIGEDFWLARVPVSKKQAVVCFPKFGTIGIGFQHEEDWNTNLPYKCPASEIYEHIRHNKGERWIRRSRCIAAIELLRQFAAERMGA
jgi:hypothetical protein